MDWLKELLAKHVDADKVDAIDKELSEELPKNFIPKGRFNEVNDELKIAKTELSDTKKLYAEATKKAETADDYQKQLSDATTKAKEIEDNAKKQIAQITKKSQLKELLMGNNAHKDALDLLVEKYTDEAEIDEKGLKNSDKLLEKIKAEKGGLFMEVKDVTKEGGAHKKGNPVDSSETVIRQIMGLPQVKVEPTK